MITHLGKGVPYKEACQESLHRGKKIQWEQRTAMNSFDVYKVRAWSRVGPEAPPERPRGRGRCSTAPVHPPVRGAGSVD